MTNLISQDKFSELFQTADINVTNEQYQDFCRYAEMLVDYNQKVNLTAITDPEGIALKHFFDSVLPFFILPVKEGASVVDVGTGAGFPSCPLKIMRNDIKLTLVDSLNKRIKFLQTLSDELGLDAECIHGRGEEVGRSEDYRAKFDIACARAVKNLSELVCYCLPFVKVGGLFYAFKGTKDSEEISCAEKNIKAFGGEISQIKEYSLPFEGGERTLIVIKRTQDKLPGGKNNKKAKKKK